MKSFLTAWFLDLKLEVTLMEAIRLRKKILDLRTHGLEKCPNFLIKLPPEYLLSLKCLLLHSNLINHFSRLNCLCLENLKGLALDFNNLTDLPFDFRHLRNLTILNVSYNRFENLRFFHVICQLKNLRILWANATGIDEIPLEIAELTKLRILGLRGNHIKSLPKAVYSLRNLRWLTLANNNIYEVGPEITNLSNLVHLNLQKNSLQRLPENFNQLPVKINFWVIKELQYLFLDHNKFTVNRDFKEFISSLSNLKYCSISRNLPHSVDDSATGIGQNNNPSSSTSFQAMVRLYWPDLLRNDLRQGNLNNLIERTHSGGNPTSQGHAPEMDFSANVEENEVEWRAPLLSGGIVQIQTEGLHVDHYQETEAQIFSQHSTESIERMVDLDEENYLGTDNEDRAGVDESDDISWTIDFEQDIMGQQCDNEDCETVQCDANMNSGPETSITKNSGDKVTSPSGEANYAEGASGEDVSNGNIDTEFERHFRTRHWISQHCLQQNESYLSKHSSQSSQNPEDEPQPNLLHRVKDHVDGLIIEASQQVMVSGNSKKMSVSGLAASVKSSASLVFIMAHGKKHFPPNSIRASASFTCDRTASSVLICPSEGSNVRNISSRFSLEKMSSLSAIHQHGVHSFENVENDQQADTEDEALDVESDLFSISDIELGNRRTLSHHDVTDEESNFDPSDWEHSAPSSAIDDQDIIVRFSDFRDEGHAENLFELLNGQYWKRILSIGCLMQ